MIFRKRGKAIQWANEVMDLSWAYRQARLVQAASGTGLFERLGAGPATAKRVAADRRLDADRVERVLTALTPMGFIARRGETFRLTPRAAATLLPDAPCYQGHTLAHSAQVSSFWNDLESILCGKKGGWRRSGEGGSPIRSYRDFILAMHNMAMAGRGAEFADRLNLRGRRTLMDVGGGPGSYAMALCERTPGLRATVFDLPQTVKIAREVIGRLGMAHRVGTVVGDWDKNEFGRDNDAVLMSNILHGRNDAVEMKLAKAHRSLAPGGLLIVQDFLMNAARTGPLIPALFNVMVGAFALPELTKRVADAGFRKIRTQPMPAHVGTTIITAEK